MTDEAISKHSILLVDDEPEILFSLKGLLRREFNLHTAESGQEALEILSQHPVHVIMTDQRMPEMTGVELMKRVKSDYPDAIRIVFTGYADINSVIEAINSGRLFRYITKPWDPDELIDVLREAVSEFDRLVQRRQLLDDLHRILEQSQQIAEQLRERVSGSDLVELKEFIEQGSMMLVRLAQLSEKT